MHKTVSISCSAMVLFKKSISLSKADLDHYERLLEDGAPDMMVNDFLKSIANENSLTSPANIDRIEDVKIVSLSNTEP